MDDYKNKLIELVRARPLLWDPHDPDYKDKDQRAQVWEDLSKILPAPKGTTHKDTWVSLNRSHCNALQRGKKKSDSAAVKSKPWKFLKQMDFLIAIKAKRSSIGNLPEATSSDEETSDLLQTALEEVNIEVESDGVDVPEQEIDVTQQGRGSAPGGTNQKKKGKVEETSDLLQTALEEVNIKVESDGVDVPEQEMDVAQQGRGSSSGRTKQKRKVEESENPIWSLMKRKLVRQSESPRMGFFRSIMPRVESLREDLFQDFQLQALQSLKNLHALQNEQGHLSGQSRQYYLPPQTIFAPIPAPTRSAMTSPSTLSNATPSPPTSSS